MIRRICLLAIIGCAAVACCQSPTPAVLPPAKPMVSVVAKPVETAPVVQTEPEPAEPAKPAAPPVLHAFIVVECLSPACAKHGHFFAATEELQRRGWGDFVTIYCTKKDGAQIDALGMGGDVYPYVVLTANNKAVDGLISEKSGKELGDWLNEQAKQRGGVWGNSSGLLTGSREPVLSAVVVSGGDWCSYCVKLKRDKPAIEAETGAHLRIIDSDSAEAKPYGVRSLPTTIILRDGTEVGREVGYGGRGPFVRFLQGVKAKGGRWE